MKWRIRIDYETGDSFGSENTHDYLDIEWENLDMAKESLRRIKNHFEFCDGKHCWTRPEGDLPVGVDWNDKWRCLRLILVDDDYNDYPCAAFWIGYFEYLHTAEIVGQDSDMKFTTDKY